MYSEYSKKSNNNWIYKEIKKKFEANPISEYYPSETKDKYGKITSFTEESNDNNKRIYFSNKYEYAHGEVEDGEYITDRKLCKSVLFYISLKLEN